jgi:hypothetical protein
MAVILSSGQEISYALYEKRKEESKLELPQLQKSLSIFPDFEEKYAPKKEEEDVFHSDEESASDILLRIATDFQKLAQKLK